MTQSKLGPRQKFLKAYGNLPQTERSQFIVIIKGKPYAWNRAYDEVFQDTELGKEILRKLQKVGIL